MVAAPQRYLPENQARELDSIGIAALLSKALALLQIRFRAIQIAFFDEKIPQVREQ